MGPVEILISGIKALVKETPKATSSLLSLEDTARTEGLGLSDPELDSLQT